jgi:hypothetical protein
MSPPKICRLNYSAYSARDSILYTPIVLASDDVSSVILHSGAGFEGQNVTINGNYCNRVLKHALISSISHFI